MAVAVLVVAWLLAQACTLSWQAAEAQRQAAVLARGESLFAWDFSRESAVVAPGSEGLEGAEHRADGLHFPPSTDTVDLSLALQGRHAPPAAYAAARVALSAEGPATVALLAAAYGEPAVAIAREHIGGGTMALLLPLPFDAAPVPVLRLRVERSAPAALVLRELQLVAPQCAASGPCAASVLLQPRATPELFLQQRDQVSRELPAAIVAAAGIPQGLAAFAAHLRAAAWMPWLALTIATGVLGWALRARRRGAPGHVAQLATLFAVPVVLLAVGYPDRGDDPVAAAAFLLCCVAALLHPGGRREWRWLGAAAAWRAAAKLTLCGLLAVVLLVATTGDGGLDALRWDRVPRYAAWALLQQALLLVAIMPRMLRSVEDPVLAALLAGAVFALLHLPNFGLMVATFAAATAWALLGRRHAALLPLAASHLLLGTLVVWAAPQWLLRSAEVGGRFLMPG